MLLAALTALPLAGCATGPRLSPEQIQARISAHDDQTCREYGASKGSEAYYECRMHLRDERIAAADADQARRAALAGIVLNNMVH